MKVPLLDLKIQFQSIRKEILSAIEDVCDDQSFVLGNRVTDLEDALSKYVGTSHAIGVASGSDALLLSLIALGVGPGDEVITVPFTFFSTASAIARLHAKPIFVDIEPGTFNMDPHELNDHLTDRTKAIIPVHLFGQCANMDAILRISAKTGIPIVEDCCQAIGASRKGTRVGSFGATGCFSFFPSKNLGGFGDGGLITTNHDRLAECLMALRVHGGHSDYHHHLIGLNSRLDALQAAVLQIKLKYLDAWTAGRRHNAQRYQTLFQETGVRHLVTLPLVEPDNFHIYNQFTIRVSKRDQLSAFLTSHGIGNKIYYPVPLHLQECFHDFGYRNGQFPVSERAAEEVLSLPIYPELTESQIRYVVETIQAFFQTS